MNESASLFVAAVSLLLLMSFPLQASTVRAATVTVVSPESPLPSIVHAVGKDNANAASDLANYLSRVSGRKIAVSPNPSAKGVVIHVGRDEFVKKHAPKIDKLFADGFIMKYVNSRGRDHIVLAGNLDRASQWAVERFMKDYCGVRWLFPDPVYGEVVPSMPTVTVKSTLNETVEPDYASRANLGMYYFEPTRSLLRGGPHGSRHGGHGLQWIFNNGSYDGEIFEKHPEWFAWFDGKRHWRKYGLGWQICTANPETVDHAVKYCLDYFAANPDAEVVAIGHNDGPLIPPWGHYGLCRDELCQNLRNSVNPPYTDSEMWWLWVNKVAKRVALKYPDKWVASLAYAFSSYPPRFALQPNVAVTKTFVLDSELDLAEKWQNPPANCQFMSMYSYPYGNGFLGFRHYPHAMKDFLKWGRDTLDSRVTISECSGDWTFDGPKYYYIQALQWDANADPDEIMTEFCDASYGIASTEMKAFWDRLEAVYERRGPVKYGKKNRRFLFLQWPGWMISSYIQPNDELQAYTASDVNFLDQSLAEAKAKAAGDNPNVQYRIDRMEEAWKYYRTFLLTKLNYYDNPPSTVVNSEETKKTVLAVAKTIADLRKDRDYYKGLMMCYPTVNPRMVKDPTNDWGGYIDGWMEGHTIFSNEQNLLQEACTSVSGYMVKTTGTASAVRYWETIGPADSLYESAQTQLYMLKNPVRTDLPVNGDFETGNLTGWSGTGSYDVISNDAHGGTCCGSLGGEDSSLSQSHPVEPQQRYRISVWGKYLTVPPSWGVPMEAKVDFYSGAERVFYTEPTRAVFRSFSPKDGWTRLRSTITVPPGADSVKIIIRKMFKGKVLIDDVKFEKIKASQLLRQGEITDRFDGPVLDASKWFSANGSSGSEPPRIDKGWLVYDKKTMYAINSYAMFDELLKHKGKDRYRLQMHLSSLDGDKSAMMAFGIKSGIGGLNTKDSGFMYYHYFNFSNTGKATLSIFSYQNGSGSSSSYDLPLTDRAKDVWYTFYFDPTYVTVYASHAGYKEDQTNLVCQHAHGIKDIAANGPVYLKLDRGKYKLNEISLSKPRISPTKRPRAAVSNDE